MNIQSCQPTISIMETNKKHQITAYNGESINILGSQEATSIYCKNKNNEWVQTHFIQPHKHCPFFIKILKPQPFRYPIADNNQQARLNNQKIEDFEIIISCSVDHLNVLTINTKTFEIKNVWQLAAQQHFTACEARVIEFQKNEYTQTNAILYLEIVIGQFIHEQQIELIVQQYNISSLAQNHLQQCQPQQFRRQMDNNPIISIQQKIDTCYQQNNSQSSLRQIKHDNFDTMSYTITLMENKVLAIATEYEKGISTTQSNEYFAIPEKQISQNDVIERCLLIKYNLDAQFNQFTIYKINNKAQDSNAKLVIEYHTFKQSNTEEKPESVQRNWISIQFPQQHIINLIPCRCKMPSLYLLSFEKKYSFFYQFQLKTLVQTITSIKSNDSNCKLDVSSFKAAQYFIRLNEQYTKKFVLLERRFFEKQQLLQQQQSTQPQSAVLQQQEKVQEKIQNYKQQINQQKGQSAQLAMDCHAILLK